jgi:hypothetical protein
VRIVGREVELRTYGGLSRYFRDRVRGSPWSSMPRDDEVRIRHLVDAAETAIRFVEGRARPDLDDVLRLALTKLVEIVVEAARDVSHRRCQQIVSRQGGTAAHGVDSPARSAWIRQPPPAGMPEGFFDDERAGPILLETPDRFPVAGTVTDIEPAQALGFEDRLDRRGRSRGPVLQAGLALGEEPISPVRTVLASTWNRSAVASNVQPRSTTHRTMFLRCRGVRRALGCCVLA